MPDAHPPLNGLHEAALYVRDLDAAEAFWRRLGFEVIGRAPGRYAFLRAGADVLLLFDPEYSAQEARDVPAHGGRGPGHVAFDVPDTGALDAWRRHLEGAGVAVEAEHAWPRGGRSLYFRDPEGNCIELITRGSWGF
jgi:catechol 2,3-dioxygenase-like lactoylglutathione lyase family enzyme